MPVWVKHIGSEQTYWKILPSSFPCLVTAFLQDGNCQKGSRTIGRSTREYRHCLSFGCLDRSPLLFPFDPGKFYAAKYNTKLLYSVVKWLKGRKLGQPPTSSSQPRHNRRGPAGPRSCRQEPPRHNVLGGGALACGTCSPPLLQPLVSQWEIIFSIDLVKRGSN